VRARGNCPVLIVEGIKNATLELRGCYVRKLEIVEVMQTFFGRRTT
jgi:hypothetical protein